MLHMQTKLSYIAKDFLEESNNKHNTESSLEPTEFLIDSFVLVQQHSITTTPETRLQTPWRGPLRVLNSKRGEYTLLDLTTNKEKKYHSSQIKQFHIDPMQTDTSDVSRKDYFEFFVEDI